MSLKKCSALIVFFLISFIFIEDVLSQTCNSCPSSCSISCGQTLSGRSTSTQEYFNFTLSDSRTVTIKMTPSSGVDYHLYVSYTPNFCPSITNYNCPEHYGMGVPESCTYNFPSGTYYILVRYSGFTGTYDLSVTCEGATTSSTTSTTTTSTSSTSTSTPGTTTSSTTTTGGTTTSSLTTSTTSGTTTSSTTTTSTSSTSTTSTVPLIDIKCANSTIFVKQSNDCNVTGCKNGYWIVSNFDKKPLEKDILSIIPPNRISFGPTKDVGKIMSSVICFDPYVMANFTTDVIKGPNLLCQESCYVDDACQCEVFDCKSGVFLLDNYEDEPIQSDVIRDLTETTFKYEFIPKDTGIIRARMFCYNPYDAKQETYIDVSSQVVTTTTPGEFGISNALCSKNECVLDVNKNEMTEAVKIFIQLIKEPEGIIYYSGTYTTMPSSTGVKTALLNSRKTCVNGTKLNMLITAYPYSDLDNRIKRVKAEAFTC